MILKSEIPRKRFWASINHIHIWLQSDKAICYCYILLLYAAIVGKLSRVLASKVDVHPTNTPPPPLSVFVQPLKIPPRGGRPLYKPPYTIHSKDNVY